ncbi:MAG: sulfur carrier protein ThiS adenylyltransferase ThiF, partial [Pseudomonadota bacterium]
MKKSIFTEGLARYFSQDQLHILSQAKIGIAGAGGLGSNCAMMLARCGVGHFVLVDHDVVDASNLNRQHFFPQHLGQLKVDALKEQMLEISDSIQIDAIAQHLHAENIQSIFASCSLVVEAVDLASTKALLTQELLTCGKTVVAASGMAGWGGHGMQKKEFGSRLIIVDKFKR